MSSYQEILDKTSDEMDRPKPLPVGTYRCVVARHEFTNDVGEEKRTVVDFWARVLAAVEESTQAALAKEGGIPEDKEIRLRYFLTDRAAYRLDDFLTDACKLGKGKLGQRVPQVVGKQILVKLKHRPSSDGKAIYNEVESTAAA